MTKEQVDQLKQGTEYVKMNLMVVGCSQGNPYDYKKKTIWVKVSELPTEIRKQFRSAK